MLNDAFIAQLLQWKSAGSRSIKIEFNEENNKPFIFIWDKEIRSGIIIKESNINANWDELIIQNRREELQESLQALDKKLEGFQ